VISSTTRRKHLLTASLLAAGTLLTACTGASPAAPSASSSAAATASPTPAASVAPSTPSSTPAQASATPAAEPTDGLAAFTCNQPASGVGSVARAQITDIRVGTHDGYDRVVFEFDAGIPPYTVEPATPPFTADASGLPIDVAGAAFLHIVLNGGTTVGSDGALTYTGATNFTPGFDELTQLIEGGDFEAVSTWYAGLATEPCIRVLTLADPSRLVLDIQH
jgi:hypothetical protein